MYFIGNYTDISVEVDPPEISNIYLRITANEKWKPANLTVVQQTVNDFL